MLAGATLLFAASALWGQAAPAAAPALQWGPAPPVFPAGAQLAVVSGDPSKAGPFVIQLKLPDGYKLAPHFHPTAEHVETISGTFMYGMGDMLMSANMKPLTVGKSVDIPANMHHYAQAKGATIVQVTSTGPFVLTYVNPADDPQKAAAKPSQGGH
jgi:hypothetical protein